MPSSPSTDELTWSPAWRLRELVANREISPVEITAHFLGRAEELDGTLRCFQELDVAGAREQAAAAERAVLDGDDLGSLHGIPVGIKSHVAVAGFGVYAMFGEPKPAVRATRDAPVVDRLRRAGAIVFGTTVIPGMGINHLRDPSNEVTTDLAHHSRNPWDLSRVPGSSSSGSCAAVAAGVLPIAIGSDGGGSTRLPAAWCGIIGLHPTRGRVPSGGRGATGWNTTLGPLARDARDTATMLQAIAGPDGRTILSLQDEPPDYLATIDAGAAGMRLAWTDDFGFTAKYAGPESARVIEAVRTAAQRFGDLGAVVEPTTQTFDDWWPHPSVMMNPGGVPFEQYEAAESARDDWWQKLRVILTDHDLLLTPTIQHVAFEIQRWSDAWSVASADYPHGTFAPTWTAHTFMHNWLGWPAVSIPCGFVDGMPVGLQLTGRPNDEARILRAANAYLRAFASDARPPTS